MPWKRVERGKDLQSQIGWSVDYHECILRMHIPIWLVSPGKILYDDRLHLIYWQPFASIVCLQVIDVDLPITVIVKITDTDPGLKGDTAQGNCPVPFVHLYHSPFLLISDMLAFHLSEEHRIVLILVVLMHQEDQNQQRQKRVLLSPSLCL